MSLDQAAKPTSARTSKKSGFTFSQHMNELSLFVAILVLYVVFTSTANGFLSFNNQINILRDAATIGIAAWAATLIIIAGEIDVSVGPMVAFISVVLAFLLQWGVPTPISFALAIVVGALLGSIAGALRAYCDVPSFVATLGLWSALRGTALFVTDALPVSIGRNDTLDALDRSVLGIPPAAIIMLVLFAIFAFVSRKTAFGRSVFAIGGNAHAAFLSGISVSGIRVALFAIAGAMAAISGILLVSRLGSGNATAATGLEFDVIAAVVVGGTSLSGGRGSMLGTLLGVLVITLIGNGLVLLGINPFFQQVVRGLIIVIAVLANIQAIKRSMSRNRG
ncbi:ABC transporter permease [Rhizobium sp. BK418]|uniref:ABC transporter permease n=1 Tax=Rhizobium sp. BK418 TaxID=2512120 RepID=UPI001046F0CB|nr:ABC transporter permease [Rhizobium sp. BK418]TCS03062.1 monosaccharide ABC transporter membrane protein (CUT2 family) [Rhizobium sp. BK418]